MDPEPPRYAFGFPAASSHRFHGPRFVRGCLAPAVAEALYPQYQNNHTQSRSNSSTHFPVLPGSIPCCLVCLLERCEVLTWLTQLRDLDCRLKSLVDTGAGGGPPPPTLRVRLYILNLLPRAWLGKRSQEDAEFDRFAPSFCQWLAPRRGGQHKSAADQKCVT